MSAPGPAGDLLGANPFPGLRPFESSDSTVFFGRDAHVDEIERRLMRVSFLAVTGESGCGKSSLVRAGLVSRLLEPAGAQSSPWRCAVMRPGDRPLAALAAAVSPLLAGADVGGRDEDLLYGRLCIGERGLIEAVQMARLPGGARVLVVVDQFEEVFRFEQDRDEAQAFVRLLLAVALDPGAPVSVVITMRSDMMGACADHRGLAEAVSRGQFLVPRLSRTQRKQAIVGPVELRGHAIEPRLVQRLLNDVSDSYDDLPVLQHALARTWRRWALDCAGSRPIDLPDYEAIGTTADAISRHGDEALADLARLDDVVQRVFSALTERVTDAGSRGRGTEGLERRRPHRLSRLRAIVGAPDVEVDQVVERFRRPDMGFLASGAPLAEDPVIDIAHESLIRLWSRLRGWIDREADDAAEFRQLALRARKHAERDGQLLDRGDLRDAKERFGRRPLVPGWAAMVLGTDDGAARTALAGIEQFLRRSRRQGWRRLAIPFALLLVGLLGVAVVDLQRKRYEARSQKFAAFAATERDRLPARAARLALGSLELDSRNPTARSTLRDALAALETAHIEKILSFPRYTASSRSADRSRLVLVQGRDVTILSTQTLAPVGEVIRRQDDLASARLTGDNRHLVTMTATGRAHLLRIGDDRAAEMRCTNDGAQVSQVAVSPYSDLAAAGCSDGEVKVGRWSDGSFVTTFAARHNNTSWPWLTALAFSRGDLLLASGDAEGRMNLWRLDRPAAADGRAWIGQGGGRKGGALGHGGAIAQLRFFPGDAGLLVSASDDRTAVVWRLDLERGTFTMKSEGSEKNKWTLKHTRAVADAMFVALQADSYPLITVEGKSVQVWDNDERKRRHREHDNWIVQMDTTDDGRLFATASDDGTARLWVTATGVPLAVLRGHRDAVRAVYPLNDAAPDPAGLRVLTIGADGQALVWRVDTPRLLWAVDHWALAANWMPDGRLLVSDEEGLHASASGGGEQKGERIGPALGRLSLSSDGRHVGGRAQASGLVGSNSFDVSVLPSGKTVLPDKARGAQGGAMAATTGDLVVWKDRQLLIWDAAALGTRAADPSSRFDVGDWTVNELAFSPDGQWIAMGTGAEIRLLRRSEPAAPPRLFHGHAGTITDLVFSADSRHLASAGTDRTARIWSTSGSGESLLAVLAGGHDGALSTLAFSADGRHVATGSADGRISLWRFDPQAATLEERSERLATLQRHSESVNHVVFGADGRSILSASDDGTVREGGCAVCYMSLPELRVAARRLTLMPDQDIQDVEAMMQARRGVLERMLARILPF